MLGAGRHAQPAGVALIRAQREGLRDTHARTPSRDREAERRRAPASSLPISNTWYGTHALAVGLALAAVPVNDRNRGYPESLHLGSLHVVRIINRRAPSRQSAAKRERVSHGCDASSGAIYVPVISQQEEDRFWIKLQRGDLRFRRAGRSAEREVDAIVRLVGLMRGQHVLDMPCGPGRHLVHFAERGFRVTGVDNTAEYLEQAQEKLNGLSVELVCEDIACSSASRR